MKSKEETNQIEDFLSIYFLGEILGFNIILEDNDYSTYFEEFISGELETFEQIYEKMLNDPIELINSEEHDLNFDIIAKNMNLNRTQIRENALNRLVEEYKENSLNFNNVNYALEKLKIPNITIEDIVKESGIDLYMKKKEIISNIIDEIYKDIQTDLSKYDDFLMQVGLEVDHSEIIEQLDPKLIDPILKKAYLDLELTKVNYFLKGLNYKPKEINFENEFKFEPFENLEDLKKHKKITVRYNPNTHTFSMHTGSNNEFHVNLGYGTNKIPLGGCYYNFKDNTITINKNSIDFKELHTMILKQCLQNQEIRIDYFNIMFEKNLSDWFKYKLNRNYMQKYFKHHN